MRFHRNILLAVIVTLALVPGALSASVVINEIFYNAPEDREDVQWLELFNNSEKAAELAGWTIDDGKVFTFLASARIEPQSYLVVALNPEQFTKLYTNRALGPLKRPLKRSGERLSLKDTQGKL